MIRRPKGFERAQKTRLACLIGNILRMGAAGAGGGGGVEEVYSGLVLFDNPTAYWRLGESVGSTAYDETANDHDGTYSNATLGETGLLTGDDDTSVDFASSGAEAVVPASTDFDNTTTGIAVEAWIKPVSGDLSEYPMIVCRGLVSTSWYLFLYEGRPAIRARVSPLETAIASSALTAGNTYHIVGVQDGGGSTGDLRIYVNGVEDGSHSSASRVNNTGALGIGRDVVGGTNEFAGHIDEVAFYAEPLTETQIRRHYYAGIGYRGYPLDVLADGAGAYWRLGESSGAEAFDELETYDADYNGSPTLGVTGLLTGDDDTAVTFDGSDDNIDTPSIMSTGSNPDFSIEFITAHTTNSSVMQVWDKNGGASDHRTTVAINRDSAFAADKISLFTRGGGGGTNAYTGTISGLHDGNPHHVVVTKTGSTVAIYVDGEAQSVTGAAETGAVHESGRGHRIGINKDGTTNPYAGTLDEVAYYDFVLTPQQVKQHYHSSLNQVGYATWNPDDKAGTISLSGGDLTATATDTSWKTVRSDVSQTRGKWYFEFTVADNDDFHMFGVGNADASVNTYCGATADSWGWRSDGAGGLKFHAGSSALGVDADAGDVIQVALDLDNGELWWGVNGTWHESSNPATRTSPHYTGVTGSGEPIFAMYSPYTSGNSVTANFGASAFSYTPPDGYQAGFFW
jgi:hypothetical protein